MPIKEGRLHKYRKYRSHGNYDLCVIFRYANGESKFSERTGNLEDHFKLAALDLPKRVSNTMAKGDLIPTQSWKALTQFDKEFERVRKNLITMLENKDETQHPMTTIRRLLDGGLDETRTAFYAEVRRLKLGRIKKGALVFDSYEDTAARAVERYQEKLARRAAPEAP